jgi:hypothetical protein
MAVLGLALLALVACGPKAHHPSHASALATNPVVQADKAQALKIIKPCLPANQLAIVTKTGRTKFLDCIVPNDPAKKAALQKCITDAATADRVTKRAGRVQFLEGLDPKRPSLVSCVIKFAGNTPAHPTTGSVKKK